jgi:hypothetical protein
MFDAGWTFAIGEFDGVIGPNGRSLVKLQVNDDDFLRGMKGTIVLSF